MTTYHNCERDPALQCLCHKSNVFLEAWRPVAYTRKILLRPSTTTVNSTQVLDLLRVQIQQWVPCLSRNSGQVNQVPGIYTTQDLICYNKGFAQFCYSQTFKFAIHEDESGTSESMAGFPEKCNGLIFICSAHCHRVTGLPTRNITLSTVSQCTLWFPKAYLLEEWGKHLK